MSQGSGNGEGALAAVPVEDTMKTEPQQVRMAAYMLDCYGCQLPLKPTIFKCDADHLVCSSCRGIHGEACGRPIAHSTLTEAFAAAAFVPCDYERYGCDSGYVVYHEVADHRLRCHHAPCGCPERCGFFGSRKKLLEHITGPEHSRTIIVVHYGKPGALSLPLSLPWHVLVGEADRSVFLVSVGDRGEEVEVSLVCIRQYAGVPSEEFSCKIAVEHSDGTRQTLESPVMRSSSLSNDAPAPGEVKWLKVRKEYLSGDNICLTFRIDKLAQPPPFSPKSPPFSPKSPPFSPTSPFSPKRPFSPPVAAPPPKHLAASPPPVAAAERKGYKRTRKGTY